MRLEQLPGSPISGEVWLYLSAQEARDLFAALEYYFLDGGSSDPEWHYHVGPGEGLTIAIEV